MHRTDFDHRELPDFQRRIFFRWRSAARGTELPPMSAFDFSQLDEPDGTLIVVEIHRDAGGAAVDFTPIYMGPSLDRSVGRHLLGRRLSTIEGKGAGSRIWAAYHALAELCVPLFVSLPFVGQRPGVDSTCEILLPLSGTVPIRADYVLTAVTFLPTQIMSACSD